MQRQKEKLSFYFTVSRDGSRNCCEGELGLQVIDGQGSILCVYPSSSF